MQTPKVRFHHVQVLRFFAAATVVLDHTFIFTDIVHKKLIDPRIVNYGGWVGGWSVALFFAISGFVIAHSSQGKSPVEFLGVRLLRIFPSYWLACLLVALVKVAVWGGVPWTAAGFTWQSLSLLPFGHRPYPLMIEWSLIYEVFFYFIFSLFLFAQWPKAKLYLSIAWLFVILGTAALGHDIADRWIDADVIFLSSRNLPFIGGVLLYFFIEAKPIQKYIVFLPIWALGIAIFAQVVSSRFWIDATQAISATALLAFAVRLDHDRPISPNNVLVRFGDASYGVYLVHISIIDIILHAWSGATMASVTVGSLYFFGLAFGLMYGVAELALYTRLRRSAPVLIRRAFRQVEVTVASK